MPRLHGAQQDLKTRARRFNVLACGRRFGKTTYEIDRLIGPALAGYPVGWFGPTYKMLAEVWRDFLRLLWPVTRRVNAQERQIELITGGVVDLWSLDAPDGPRGRKYRRIAVDEAARVRNLLEVWALVLRPTLADYAGDADFCSTPHGYDDFETLFGWGQDPARPEWAAFQRPTADNPHIPPAEIAAMRSEMTALQYRQEVLAEFVNMDAGLFKREWFPITSPVADGAPVAFVDLATSTRTYADYTALAVVSMDAEARVTIRDLVRGRWEWPETRRIILQTVAAQGVTRLGIESVGFQLAAVQELLREPALVNVELAGITPERDKVSRALAWAHRAEQGRVALAPGPWNTTFLQEIADFPSGTHDDQVDAVSGAIALLGTAAPGVGWL